MRCKRFNLSRGFTAIELIFVIAIVGILTSLAVYSTIKWTQRVKVRTFAIEVLSDFEWARSLAFKKGSSKVKFYTDRYEIYAPSDSTTLIKSKISPEGIAIKPHLAFGRTKLKFKRNKLPDIGGNVTIENANNIAYKIVIKETSGRIFLERER